MSLVSLVCSGTEALPRRRRAPAACRRRASRLPPPLVSILSAPPAAPAHVLPLPPLSPAASPATSTGSHAVSPLTCSSRPYPDLDLPPLSPVLQQPPLLPKASATAPKHPLIPCSPAPDEAHRPPDQLNTKAPPPPQASATARS